MPLTAPSSDARKSLKSLVMGTSTTTRRTRSMAARFTGGALLNTATLIVAAGSGPGWSGLPSVVRAGTVGALVGPALMALAANVVTRFGWLSLSEPVAVAVLATAGAALAAAFLPRGVPERLPERQWWSPRAAWSARPWC
jgi:hypothetical protein